MAVGVGAVVKRTAIALPIVIASLVLPGMAVVDESSASSRTGARGIAC